MGGLVNTGIGWHFPCLHSEKAAAPLHTRGGFCCWSWKNLGLGGFVPRAQGCSWVLLVLPLSHTPDHIPSGLGAQLLLSRRESYSIKIREQMLVHLGHGAFLLFVASQRDLPNQQQ